MTWVIRADDSGAKLISHGQVICEIVNAETCMLVMGFQALGKFKLEDNWGTRIEVATRFMLDEVLSTMAAEIGKAGIA